jgi:hypothetical protein
MATNNADLQAEIDAAVAEHLAFTPEQRMRLIEPYMAFLSGVNKLSSEQVLHLVTMREYHATLEHLRDMEAQRALSEAAAQEEAGR